MRGEPSDRRVLFSALGWMGVILMFLVILAIAYLPNQGAPVDQARIGERLAWSAEVAAEQDKLVTTYAVIDAEAGVVRIPVERAMELVIDDLNARPVKAVQGEEPPSADPAGNSK